MYRVHHSETHPRSVTFTLPTASHSIIALSKYDTRYFKQIDGPSQWNFDFVIVKEGELEPFIESSYGFFGTRNVNVELDLEAGKYHVLVSCTFVLVAKRWLRRK